MLYRFVALLFAAGACLYSAVLSGTVKDATGAAVPQASITIAGPALPTALTIQSDASGLFKSPDLKPGRYTVVVHHSGFTDATREVDLANADSSLSIVLSVAEVREQVSVAGGAGSYANSDPVYRGLRSIETGKAIAVQGDMTVDVGTFNFHSGTLTFLAPVNGVITGAVFNGDAEFTLEPFLPIDKSELRRRTSNEVFTERFSSAVFRFTNAGRQGLMRLAKGSVETSPEAGKTLSQFEEKLRRRHEDVRSMAEYALYGDEMDNVEADMLAAVYNPHHPFIFNAYIKGSKHGDLRFFVRDHGGALPEMDSPEEVALINYAPSSFDDGILYMQHKKVEYERGTASSTEEKRYFAAKAFKIDTFIGGNGHLASTASIELQPLVAGERVIKFNLLPNLRVTRVTGDGGRDLFYIQEGRKDDGSFYAILPEPADPAKTYTVKVEYFGDHVIHDAGGGSFYVGARESWYPSPNVFGERSLFDLTFHVPHKYSVISVGKLQSASEEDKLAVTHWITPKPVPIAGFNYGAYKQEKLMDEQTKTEITGFYLPELPDILRFSQAAQSLAPDSMTKYALNVTRAQLQICTNYFGADGFDHIYITEQPNFFFGQSWPNLVYLPISAYTDSTQRYMLFGRIENRMTAFVQEVTPHEVAHQWWGHAVPWASYHDQWLSEGFAEFSAALFVQQGQGPGHEKDYKDFWDRLRKEVMEKRESGLAPNDVGPIWMGIRLQSGKDEAAYQYNIYPKGAYILNMLRSLMSSKDGDKQFIDMMHDFVASHRDRPASTETFKQIAEKHLPPNLDFDKNGRLDWFFNEWVYGTEVPRYSFASDVTPEPGGKVKVKMTLTQSEVSPRFVMAVPVFAQTDKNHWFRFGQLTIAGSNSRTVEAELPGNVKAVAMDIYDEILKR